MQTNYATFPKGILDSTDMSKFSLEVVYDGESNNLNHVLAYIQSHKVVPKGPKGSGSKSKLLLD